MRKQLYYALAAVILGSAATPETGYAESVLPSSAPTTTTLSSADASQANALNKRKKRKKRRSGRRRH